MEIDHLRAFLNFFLESTWMIAFIGLWVALLSHFGADILRVLVQILKFLLKFLVLVLDFRMSLKSKKTALKKLQRQASKEQDRIFSESFRGKGFLKRLFTIASGLFVVYLSFPIVNTALVGITDGGQTFPYNVKETWQAGDGLLAYLQYHAGFTGIISLSMLILAGFFLMISGGNRWPVNTAKLLLTFTALYIFFMGAIVVI
jgi:hypothetical protein